MKKRFKIVLFILGLIGIIACVPLPASFFSMPTSSLLYAQNGVLLEAEISTDGQWRFPPNDTVSTKFEQAILHFEDQWFYYHLGINPIAIFRAIRLNIKNNKVVSGGSTITMQVARMLHGNHKRTVFQKFVEVLYALKLELFYSKEEILLLYCNNAPFGGNTVGIEAAAWRYFGRASNQLSWAENAALAVLPNAPALVFPGKNEAAFLHKRNKLLLKLFENKVLNQEEYELALIEPLPGKPKKLPSLAPHLLQYSNAHGNKGKSTVTTLAPDVQHFINATIERYQSNYSANKINNIGVLVVNTYSGEVVAYAGNYHPKSDASTSKGYAVDMVHGLRSTGSILKPFLFAALMQDGALLPRSLVADLPTSISGYSPTNFNNQYSGAVPLNLALSRSLNIPSVRLLKQYNTARFLTILKSIGFTSFTQNADHYGLSLILGGGEVSLWELCGVYASMGRSLQTYFSTEGKLKQGNWSMPHFVPNTNETIDDKEFTLLNTGAIYLTLDALKSVIRPQNEAGWEYFNASESIAWKTGTSFGFRDAWAVGVTPDYTVGVWVGNATGEGRPGLVGGLLAAPVMFDIFRNLPSLQNPNFDIPYDDLRQEMVCQESGMLAGALCAKTDSMYVHKNAFRSASCNFHKSINLNTNNHLQANLNCVKANDLYADTFFTLPPGMEYYYAKNHPDYKKLPGFSPGCIPLEEDDVIEIISPTNSTEIVIPRELDGTEGKVIFVAAHRKQNMRVFWHLDGVPIGSTTDSHTLAIEPESGQHLLVLVDEEGHRLSYPFKAIKE